MRRDQYTPDVFELEEKWQKKNPEWFRQYVDDEPEAAIGNPQEDNIVINYNVPYSGTVPMPT